MNIPGVIVLVNESILRRRPSTSIERKVGNSGWFGKIYNVCLIEDLT